MDRDARVCGFEPINAEAYGAVCHEIGEGEVYRDERVRVEAFSVEHGEDWLALGYQFTTADRRIVVSGDTAPKASLIEQWRGCDLLVHEVYSHRAFQKRSPKWQHYHAHMHTSTRERAEIARQVQPKKLVLPHILFWGAALALVVGGLIIAGGLGAIQTAMVIGALPFSFVMVLMGVSLIKAIWRDGQRIKHGLPTTSVVAAEPAE